MPNLLDFIKGAWENKGSTKTYVNILRGRWKGRSRTAETLATGKIRGLRLWVAIMDWRAKEQRTERRSTRRNLDP
jgi:hypothetical protein